MKNPLVSVIIPCFNHGKYLREALESIWSQDYPNIEVVIVDDGSTDDTKSVCEEIQNVKYIYQSNQGLSAARNTGIRNSAGDLLVFLDADDWLLPGALETNSSFLLENEKLAFVSGLYELNYIDKGEIEGGRNVSGSDYYLHFLQGNYIGMIAAVMFRRWVFDKFLFDSSLKCCEDYDLYLKITRKYPVQHHSNKIAVYRMHDFNMSNNIPLMLETALEVLRRQNDFLANKSEKMAFKRGEKNWKHYYSAELFKKALDNKSDFSETAVFFNLWKYNKAKCAKYFLYKSKTLTKKTVKKATPDFLQRIISKTGIYRNYVPAQGKIKFGDFKQVTPFSTKFGYDRGGPVDRYYIENFLKRESDKIKGRVLEIGDNEYTLQFGGNRVTRSEILHVDDQNPKATIIGDLSDASNIQTESFDCIILTQTLHLIYDFRRALENCFRILKPGGVLLITVPGISQIDYGSWKKNWLWSFTDNSLNRLLTEIFPVENVIIETFGNVLAATAFLYGIGLPEINKEQMDYNDPHYQVVISGVAIKSE